MALVATTWTPPKVVAALHGLRGHRMPWLAIAFACGCGGYFALPVEPTQTQFTEALVICLALFALAWGMRHSLGFLLCLAALVFAGGLAAQMRSAMVAGPVLQFRYYGPVEGRIIAIDRSASGAPRLTLDRVRLDRVDPADVPRRVRLSLQDPGNWVEPMPGMRVMTTAHLGPPPGPVEPGGFDFQRHVWFLSLGALGYSRTPLLLADTEMHGAPLAQIRRSIAEGLRQRMPGRTGEVAAAITTGDRSGLPDDVVEALRASNLAHLLAISGLHMGLLVGFAFWSVRGGLALMPRIALTAQTRIWAAAVALPIAAVYLGLSGASVATQRAFIMAAVMLGAVMLGRRALSVRSVAIAALIVLALRPESLVGPGFQMSFAATAALVLAFGWLSRADAKWRHGLRGWAVALLLSSTVAGLATAPIAAAHFGRVGQFGLLANVLAVPAMGALVMPALFLGLLMWPLGLEAAPLWVASKGIEWIIWVAEFVAGLPASVIWVPAPPAVVLPMLGLGMALFGAARGAWRALSLPMLGMAALSWGMAERPAILIAEDGRLVGWLGADGRALSHDRGAGFVAGAWLENDGDPVDQASAAARVVPDLPGLPTVLIARGKRSLAEAAATCSGAGGRIILVTDQRDVPSDLASGGRCAVFSLDLLRQTGAISIRATEEGGRLDTARAQQGTRPWSPASKAVPPEAIRQMILQ